MNSRISHFSLFLWLNAPLFFIGNSASADIHLNRGTREVEVSIATQAGAFYVVERTSDPAAEDWETIIEGTAGGIRRADSGHAKVRAHSTVLPF